MAEPTERAKLLFELWTEENNGSAQSAPHARVLARALAKG